ncbi:MAG: 1-acyl-sn-glycerol-3-phosphate acyltransferase [Candidatus Marinimicrobia bacterium]|nr:1-acyl-sn-glycerol-3-phosphate acyltransferase [Candidatus Neomarinimicrobiota bacterium]
MQYSDEYHDIIPYNDENMKPVLNNLVREPAFLKLAQSINPAITSDLLAAQAAGIHNIHDFQIKFISPIVASILQKSVNKLTYSGLENLRQDSAYLFISNHRDILLDSTLLNYILLHNGFNSTQMAIGDNLLIESWITDFFKLNKSFIVKRGLPGRELLKSSKIMSHYINETINVKKESIWIAQREGRTKDGYDETNPGLLKMLVMADNHFKDLILKLNIVPVAISYQYESCDKLKAKELYKRENSEFKKGPKSDLFSMITGIRGHKGNIHIAIGQPLNRQIMNFDEALQKNDFLKELADLIDEKIHALYRLWDTNYIAYDLLNNTNSFADKYSSAEKSEFSEYVEKLCTPNEKLKPFLLKIYAGPVDNSIK